MADPRYLFEPLLFQAITPIHVGSGQDVGLVTSPEEIRRAEWWKDEYKVAWNG